MSTISIVLALLLTTSTHATPLSTSTLEPTKVTVMATATLAARQAETLLPWTPAWTDPAWTTPSPSGLTSLEKSTSLEGGVLVAIIIGSLLAFGLLGCVIHWYRRGSSGSCCRRRTRIKVVPCVERDAGLNVAAAARTVRQPKGVHIAAPRDDSEHGPYVTWTRGKGFTQI
ncbi:hypothetical protein Ptr902_12049 [Pyrenophora tritici-repentis]|nr:hypothetical protein Ptr902_13119 [Pyrenophora tritici-repentis]KAI2476415.1 hypothetical protein Ptr902_12049 [Pyrenophora tritici-repentis]